MTSLGGRLSRLGRLAYVSILIRWQAGQAEQAGSCKYLAGWQIEQARQVGQAVGQASSLTMLIAQPF